MKRRRSSPHGGGGDASGDASSEQRGEEDAPDCLRLVGGGRRSDFTSARGEGASAGSLDALTALEWSGGGSSAGAARGSSVAPPHNGEFGRRANAGAGA